MINKPRLNFSAVLIVTYWLLIMSPYLLKIIAWNVRGIMSSTIGLNQLIKQSGCDICIISEHKLKNEYLSYLSSIENGYKCIAKADSLPSNYQAYHGKGGIGILYKTTLSFSVSELDIDQTERIVGLELRYQGGSPLYIFGVYLPSDDVLHKYKDELDTLEALYSHYIQYGNVIIAGDLNGSYLDRDMLHSNRKKGEELSNFVRKYDFPKVIEHFVCKGVNFSFVPKKTMIDYILFNESLLRQLRSYEILPEGKISTTSDHLPIIAEFYLSENPHEILRPTVRLPAWHKANETELRNYQLHLEDPIERLIREINDESDTKNVNDLYESFKNVLNECANKTIPKTGFNPYTKPYWSDNVREAHKKERYYRTIWISENRPRGMTFDSYRNYKRAKYEFRRVQHAAFETYIKKTYDDLNNASECDIRLFWRLVKRMKPSDSKLYPEIKYNGHTYNTPEGVSEAFAKYFENMYRESNYEDFDQINKQVVDEQFDEIIQETIDNKTLPGGKIQESEIELIVKNLKKRKAGGYDQLQNEHLMYGGKIVRRCLTSLMNVIVSTGCIPNGWRVGLIIPLHKGHGKAKSSPDNYRPISLLSCVLKVFEHIVKTRMVTHCLDPITFPCKQQQGFQAGLSCLNASFNLHETLFHNIEQGSTTFVAFLDSRKAFDTVWRHGLIVKLYKLGVKGQVLKLINKCYTKTTSAIIVNQCQSRFFPVYEGVRQGGVLSGLLYLVFIDELINLLEQSNSKTGIYNITCCVPSLADDIACVSTSPAKLQSMLNVCYEYSRNWRFRFNANKSCILQFTQNARSRDIEFNWKIGNDVVPRNECYTHLGIELNSKFKPSERISNCCRKGKNAYFSLKGVNSKLTNPVVMIKLYKTVILPSVLYGCEMWGSMRKVDIVTLSRFQHFVIKNILNLPITTRSDMCQSLMGIYTIDAYIDKCKLMFLRKLCTMDINSLSRKIFDTRLFSYLIDTNHTHFGFIPDIVEILDKYGLAEYILDYILDGEFPPKPSWKLIVNCAIATYQNDKWRSRIEIDSDFTRFRQLHEDISITSLWTEAKTASEIRQSYVLTKLWTDKPYSSKGTCGQCNRSYDDFFVHVCCNCPATSMYRDVFWDFIMEDFPVELFIELNNYCDEELYTILLGKETQTSLDIDEVNTFTHLCRIHVITSMSSYNKLC